MRQSPMWLVAMFLVLAGPVAAGEIRLGTGGQGSSGQIPVALQQWTQAVTRLEKEYGRYAFLNANLNRTFAISRKLPPDEVSKVARSVEELSRNIASLDACWQRVEADRPPPRYLGAIAAWKAKISAIHAAMGRDVCSYCDLTVASPSGDASAISSCTEKTGEGCANDPCLDCCERLPDAGQQSLCGIRCQYRAALCLLDGIVERQSGNGGSVPPP
ncbi:MAG: hypothetical protein F9K32_04190 [Desulfobulbaceae bacterium]|nr:MAG: hypothetical protein F9K32_04190 [Desulfobulbaceae bacterium]